VSVAGIWFLPAWDAALPGGALPWQAVLLGVGLGLAVWTRRRWPAYAAGRGRVARLLGRAAAAAALVGLIATLGGLALLLLVWPR
jgi:hypothetical protein